MEELKPSLSQLTKVFFKIGNTTFGGGYVTMGMMGREMVETRQWLKASEFDLAFALARVTPGTNLLAFCAAVGQEGKKAHRRQIRKGFLPKQHSAAGLSGVPAPCNHAERLSGPPSRTKVVLLGVR